MPASKVAFTSSAAPTATSTAATPSGPVTVTVLHTNDMHGSLTGERITGGNDMTFEFGGIANVMGTIARLKSEVGPNRLVIDAGDFWQGTFASNRDDGRAIVASMNIVGYDVVVPGNHDFDHGQEVLKELSAEAQFPFLAANILEQSTYKPPAWLKPYIVKEIAGIRFGIIGLANSGTPVISKASNSKGLVFLNEMQALRDILPEVKAISDLSIVVSHQGADLDQRMAANVPGIDLIVGGHSHTEIKSPRVEGSTMIVQAGAKALQVGRLDLKIDPASKRIVDHTRSGELVAAVSPKAATPPQIAEMLDKLVTDAKDAMSRPLGETRTDLVRQYTADGRTTGEYPLGNLVVDAMLAANQAGDRSPDIAMYNQGVRADLPKGVITYGKLYEVFPFDNTLAAVDLTGAQIKAILEIAVSCPRVNTLVSGMSFEYDCSATQGARTSQIRIQGKPMGPGQVYRVQTIDYLVGGGDGQTPFTQGKNIVYGDPVIDVLAAYVQQHSPLDLKTEGRIVAAGQ